MHWWSITTCCLASLEFWKIGILAHTKRSVALIYYAHAYRGIESCGKGKCICEERVMWSPRSTENCPNVYGAVSGGNHEYSFRFWHLSSWGKSFTFFFIVEFGNTSANRVIVFAMYLPNYTLQIGIKRLTEGQSRSMAWKNIHRWESSPFLVEREFYHYVAASDEQLLYKPHWQLNITNTAPTQPARSRHCKL